MKIRLDKMLSHAGYGTRKEVKEYIRKGEVIINGEVVKDDDFKCDPDIDEIIVFDEEVNYLNKVYVMLNKPVDVVSATYDERYKTVIDIVDEYRSYSVFPVGRLDIDTVGLLLISNDGKLAHKLLAPKSHVDKTYFVRFTGEFKESYIKKFNEGIVIDDGYKTLPSKIELLSDNEANLTIYEGKYHQVKRMFEALNMEVIYLQRISFGPLKLDLSLKEGEYRLLSEDEIKELYEYEREN